MYPLAHAGFAAALGRLGARRVALSARGIAALALGGVLPDLLDKPLGFFVLHVGEGRLVGHTLVFALAWLALGVAWKRSLLAWPALVGWGCLSHLLLDLPHAATVLWPFLGTFPIRGYTLDAAGFLRPSALVGEVAGGLTLALLAWERWSGRSRRGHRVGNKSF